MKQEDNIQYNHNFNLSTDERYYQVCINGMESTYTFSRRLKLKQKCFEEIVRVQFNAIIVDLSYLVFISLEDFNKFKEWYLLTHSMSNLINNV